MTPRALGARALALGALVVAALSLSSCAPKRATPGDGTGAAAVCRLPVSGSAGDVAGVGRPGARAGSGMAVASGGEPPRCRARVRGVGQEAADVLSGGGRPGIRGPGARRCPGRVASIRPCPGRRWRLCAGPGRQGRGAHRAGTRCRCARRLQGRAGDRRLARRGAAARRGAPVPCGRGPPRRGRGGRACRRLERRACGLPAGARGVARQRPPATATGEGRVAPRRPRGRVDACHGVGRAGSQRRRRLAPDRRRAAGRRRLGGDHRRASPGPRSRSVDRRGVADRTTAAARWRCRSSPRNTGCWPVPRGSRAETWRRWWGFVSRRSCRRPAAPQRRWSTTPGAIGRRPGSWPWRAPASWSRSRITRSSRKRPSGAATSPWWRRACWPWSPRATGPRRRDGPVSARRSPTSAAHTPSTRAASTAVAAGVMPKLDNDTFQAGRVVSGAEAIEVMTRLEPLVARAAQWPWTVGR